MGGGGAGRGVGKKRRFPLTALVRTAWCAAVQKLYVAVKDGTVQQQQAGAQACGSSRRRGGPGAANSAAAGRSSHSPALAARCTMITVWFPMAPYDAPAAGGSAREPEPLHRVRAGQAVCPSRSPQILSRPLPTDSRSPTTQLRFTPDDAARPRPPPAGSGGTCRPAAPLPPCARLPPAAPGR